MSKYAPGSHVRHKVTGAVAVVYCCTCRGYVLWPLTEGGMNPTARFVVSFARMARDYEEAP